MTELNSKLQKAAELARRNIAALKAQKANPLKLSPVVPRTADGRRVAARQKLTEACAPGDLTVSMLDFFPPTVKEDIS